MNVSPKEALPLVQNRMLIFLNDFGLSLIYVLLKWLNSSFMISQCCFSRLLLYLFCLFSSLAMLKFINLCPCFRYDVCSCWFLVMRFTPSQFQELHGHTFNWFSFRLTIKGCANSLTNLSQEVPITSSSLGLQVYHLFNPLTSWICLLVSRVYSSGSHGNMPGSHGNMHRLIGIYQFWQIFVFELFWGSCFRTLCRQHSYS